MIRVALIIDRSAVNRQGIVGEFHSVWRMVTLHTSWPVVHVKCKLQYVNNKTIISDATDHYLPLTFRSLPQTFIRRSLFYSSSSSCHGRVVTWQEIGRRVAECVAALVAIHRLWPCFRIYTASLIRLVLLSDFRYRTVQFLIHYVYLIYTSCPRQICCV